MANYTPYDPNHPEKYEIAQDDWAYEEYDDDGPDIGEED